MTPGSLVVSFSAEEETTSLLKQYGLTEEAKSAS